MKYYVYIVQSDKDKSLYTGVTNNLERRVREHNSGNRGSKYTRSRRPVKLIYKEEFDTKSEAMRREYFIKQLSKKQKEILMLG